MVELKRIVKFLDEYLKIKDIKDTSWNGLQVEGKSEIKKIVFAVDAGIETFEKAIQEKADMIIVHHGHFWKEGDPAIKEGSKERIELLLKNNISLYAAHLPLDRHKEVGNNAQLLKILDAKIKEEFAEHDGQNVGWIGELKKPKSITEIEKLINSKLKTKSTILPFGKEKIKTIAVCSGGGGYPTLFEALNKKVDLYLTGDAIEVYHSVKDAKINVIFAGHHTTETVGVQALSEIIKKEFDVETVFIDIPTGL
ncbi:MAG: Nif3-like dinuclear metal center hexameric protein [Nanoarchaeota archaeon]|nr:Nif3-like dinuclear metal center hexameric protein [Nanoarchaeota archaeon]